MEYLGYETRLALNLIKGSVRRDLNGPLVCQKIFGRAALFPEEAFKVGPFRSKYYTPFLGERKLWVGFRDMKLDLL